MSELLDFDTAWDTVHDWEKVSRANRWFYNDDELDLLDGLHSGLTAAATDLLEGETKQALAELEVSMRQLQALIYKLGHGDEIYDPWETDAQEN